MGTVKHPYHSEHQHCRNETKPFFCDAGKVLTIISAYYMSSTNGNCGDGTSKTRGGEPCHNDVTLEVRKQGAHRINLLKTLPSARIAKILVNKLNNNRHESF